MTVQPSGIGASPPGFVRPLVQSGRVVLHVRPAEQGWVPFEQRDPTPCCADH
ncbi:MAG: hypothetical protein HOQ22_00255 [Nocardioidaceae bacterium]|nr:hypothetical protein [Nocardioidaceae bacterium]NUS49459.1 hypothetical protein [Nocardioidaceae bacterium]